ncbi:MAG: extracellular solute-binding protein, partial [Gemmatimonadetes bacterium]|nr:extracellular solute-binding protein [Gemmatimonadota bacterium]
SEVSNLYQEFARGYFSMYVTGPWNLGEFERRLPPELAEAWATAPLPGPEGIESGVSLAGGSSIVLFRSSERKEAAWKLIEFLSEPGQQLRFFELTGDLPARTESWEAESIASNERILAFGEQLKRVVATPKIPEWEQIATRIMIRAEEAIRGSATIDQALEALDRDVDRLLEKRRWLLEKRGLLPEASPS